MNMFYKILVFFTALLLPSLLTGQIDSIRQIEGELSQASGNDRIVKRITLARLHNREGHHEDALRLAESAYRLANYENNTNLMAQSLFQSSRALIAQGNNKQARKQLWEGVRLLEKSPNQPLLADKLNLLRTIAKQTGRKSELEDIEKQLADVQSQLTKHVTVGVGEAESPKKPVNLLGAFDAATLELSKELSTLHKSNLELQRDLLDRQKEIQEMSEQQMQQELVLALQKNMLDSLELRGLRDSLLLVQQDSKLNEQKAEIQLQRSQSNLFLALAAIVLLIAAGMFARFRSIKRYNNILEEKNSIIQEEQRRSEDLLLNILPAAVAGELKLHGAAKARHYKEVTVMFTDFEGFSKISPKLSPEELVADLDYCFKNFDLIIEKYGLEKIKTIGDAYMCAGGLPVPSREHPSKMIWAAIEIQQFLDRWKQEKIQAGKPFFEARLGIHTGPIVAGVVGVKKFAYDIWGDTVNIAARMESSSEVGKINISEMTYALVKDQFKCSYRGKIPAKNMGEIDMYYVEVPVGEAVAV